MHRAMRKISIYPIYRSSLCIQQLLNEVCQSSNHQCTFVTICSIQPRCWEYVAKINGQQLKIFSESVMVRFEEKNDVPLITWIVIRCFFLSLLSAALFFFNVSYVLSVFFSVQFGTCFYQSRTKHTQPIEQFIFRTKCKSIMLNEKKWDVRL